MRNRRIVFLSMLIVAFAAVAVEDEAGFVVLEADDLVWKELEPGIDFAVLAGDPGKNEFYVIRARFGPGVFSAPHYHPNDRHITVIEGTWWAGTGGVFDKEATVPLGPGSYMMHPGGGAHFDGAKQGTVIVQISGMGPAPLVYVDEDGRPIS